MSAGEKTEATCLLRRISKRKSLIEDELRKRGMKILKEHTKAKYDVPQCEVNVSFRERSVPD